MVVPALSAASLEVHLCKAGDRGTLRRLLTESFPDLPAEHEDWHYGHLRISARKVAPEEPRTIWQLDGPLLARRLHHAAPEGLRWRPLWPFLDNRTSETRYLTLRSSPSAKLLCNPLYRGHGPLSLARFIQQATRALLHLKPAPLSKRRVLSSPPPLLCLQLALNSSRPAIGSTTSASASVCTCVSRPRRRSTR